MSSDTLLLNGWPVGRVAAGCFKAASKSAFLRASSAAAEMVYAATGSESAAADLVESLTFMWGSGGYSLDEFVDEIVNAGDGAFDVA